MVVVCRKRSCVVAAAAAVERGATRAVNNSILCGVWSVGCGMVAEG
jgi:hypothetical protein